MGQTLSEAIHDRLDAMGAPPRDDSTMSPPDLPEQDQDPQDDTAIPEPDGALDAERLAAETLDEPDETEAQDGDEEFSEGEEPEQWKAAEFAELVGLTPEELYSSLVFQMGDERLTLGELKDRAQGTLPPDIEAQRAEVEQARQQITQQWQELQQQQQSLLSGQQEVAQEIMDARGQKKAIEIQYSNVDWDKMDQEDPGKAALLRQKFAAAYAQSEAQIEQAQQKINAEQQQAVQQMIVREHGRLMQLVPEWKDRKAYEAEYPKVADYLVSRGFTPDELRTIYHAGAQAVARDAWLWNQHKQQIADAAKKVSRAPKRELRPVRAPAADLMRDKQVQELEARARQTGTQADRLSAARGIMQTAMAKRRKNHGTRTRSGRS